MPRFKKSLEQRLDVLEQFAEANTIAVTDFFAIVDCLLLACALHLDIDTMEKIEAETNTLFLTHLGRTSQWSWREERTRHARA